MNNKSCIEEKHGCAVNLDSDFLWYIYKSTGSDMNEAEKKLDASVDGYRDRGISDLIYCIFCQSSVFPSRVMSWFGDKEDEKTENGISVDYSNHDRLLPYKLAYENMDEEPIQHLLNKTREAGMRAWLSVRMNDCHNNADATSWIRGDFFYEAKKNGWMIGDAVPRYFSTCYDYSVPQVRDKFYTYIREILDRYDVDGLELDFMREIYCFDYPRCENATAIMVEFLSKIREYARKKEAERGHRIILGIRLCPDIEYNRVLGFDVNEIIGRGLCDVIVPTTRWQSTDSEMAIDRWKNASVGTGTEIWAGIEFFTILPAVNSHETVSALAAQYCEMGADKIYLYNFYRECIQDAGGMEKYGFTDTSLFKDYSQYESDDTRTRKIWNAASDYETAARSVRRHILSPSDIVPDGYRSDYPLPLYYNGEANVSKLTGEIKGKKILLYLGVDPQDRAPEVLMDGITAALIGLTDDAYFSKCEIWGGDREDLGDVVYYAYSAEASSGFTRRITLRGKGRLSYLEIKVT